MSKVTVVIPCHNYGEWVVHAINSVTNQTYPKDQLSISLIDDGSTDDSWSKIKNRFDGSVSYDKFNGHTVIFGTISGIPASAIRIPNPTGPSNARNMGIEYTIKNTDIYAFLDADDMMKPNKLEVMVPYLCDQVGVIYADYETVSEEGVRIREYKEPFDKVRFLQENIGPNNTSIVSATALLSVRDENGFFDRTMRTCEDYDLFMRISKKYLIVHLPYSLTTLRIQSKNSTSTVAEARWVADRKRVFEKQRG